MSILGSTFDGETRQRRRYERQLHRLSTLVDTLTTSEGISSMVKSLIAMDALCARDVMVPRIDVTILNANCRRGDLEKLLENNPYSRIPVYKENIDNIQGILHVKDISRILLKLGSPRKIEISRHLSDAFFVPESKRITEILREFQSQHIQFAVVVDEYGGFSGIVTMEDIIEEIIGDIQDEFDEEQEEIKQLDNGNYSIDARLDLETINQRFGLDLPTREVDTIGGFLIMQAGYIPKQNQHIHYGDLVFKVLSKRKNSLIRIRMSMTGEKGETAP